MYEYKRNFSNSNLHDYEFREINLCYDTSKILIILRDSTSKLYDIEICNVKFFSLSHYEPWGIGKYICSSDVYENCDGLQEIVLELNSGDVVKILYEEKE